MTTHEPLPFKYHCVVVSRYRRNFKSGVSEEPMLDIFMYPVSGIMKLWHILLHSVLGINDSLAWVLSIFGLIIVVRGLIAPAQWYILHSDHLTIMMRLARQKATWQHRHMACGIQRAGKGRVIAAKGGRHPGPQEIGRAHV